MDYNAIMLIPVELHVLKSLIQDSIRAELQAGNLSVNNANHDLKDLMTIEEVKDYLGVSKVTIHKWKKDRVIQSYRIGRKIFFKRFEIENSIKKVTFSRTTIN